MSTLDDKLEEETVVTGTVLVVDDEPSVYEPAQQLLELQKHSTRNGTDFNWRVYTASNPFQALDIARRFRPGVAIVDLNYPRFDEDGYWLLSELKKIDKTIAVGVLTGDNRPETIKEAVRRADNYWVKPVVFDSPKFLADLRELEDLSSEDRINLIHALRSRLNLGLEPSFSVEEEPYFEVPDNIGRLIEAVYHLPSNTGDLRTGAKGGVAQVDRVNLKMPFDRRRVATVIKLYERPEFDRQLGNYLASMRMGHWHPPTPHYWPAKDRDGKPRNAVFGVHRVVPGTPYSHIFDTFDDMKKTALDNSTFPLIERVSDALINTALEESVKRCFDDRFTRPTEDRSVKIKLSHGDITSVQGRYSRDFRSAMSSLREVAGLLYLGANEQKEYDQDIAIFLGTTNFKIIAPFNDAIQDTLLLPTLLDLSTGNIGIAFKEPVMRPSPTVLIALISQLEREGPLSSEFQKRFGFFEGSNKTGKGYEGSSMAEDWAHFLNSPELGLTTSGKLANAKKLIGMYRQALTVPLNDTLGLRIYLEMTGYRGLRKARNINDDYRQNNWTDYIKNIKTWEQAVTMDKKYFAHIKHWVAQSSWAWRLGYALHTMLDSGKTPSDTDNLIEAMIKTDAEDYSRSLVRTGLPQNPVTPIEVMLYRHNFLQKWYGPERLVYVEPSLENIRRPA